MGKLHAPPAHSPDARHRPRLHERPRRRVAVTWASAVPFAGAGRLGTRGRTARFRTSRPNSRRACRSGAPSPDPGLGAIVPGGPRLGFRRPHRRWCQGRESSTVGSKGLAGRIGTVLPASVTLRCYTSVGVFSSSPADCANGELHGTAVAEALSRVAPGISLYLADPQSSADLAQTVAWMTSSGVRVINRSMGGGFEGPGDGTSPYTDSTYGVIDAAVSGERSGSTRWEYGRGWLAG